MNFPSRNRRKADQHRRMAEMARRDNDPDDAARHEATAAEFEKLAEQEGEQ